MGTLSAHSTDPRTVVERYNYELWNERNYAVGEQIIGEQIIRNTPGSRTVLTHDEAVQRVRDLWEGVRSVHFTLPQIVAGNGLLALDDYLADWIRQSAVERQLEIVGEALVRIRRDDSETSARIPDIHAIIATRNVIIHIHRYDDVDHVRVWAMLQHDIPRLIPTLESLLEEFGPPER